MNSSQINNAVIVVLENPYRSGGRLVQAVLCQEYAKTNVACRNCVICVFLRVSSPSAKVYMTYLLLVS